MEREDTTKQALVEREMLMHIERALRVVLDWKVGAGEFSRKLSTLRFVAQSFQRHLDRVGALDRHDGYVNLINDTKPRLLPAAEALQQNHARLQTELDRLTSRLDRVSTTDHTRFDAVCAELVAFLDQLKQHNAKEAELFQEAFVVEEGGEG